MMEATVSIRWMGVAWGQNVQLILKPTEGHKTFTIKYIKFDYFFFSEHYCLLGKTIEIDWQKRSIHDRWTQK
jgi:hypothetical protein